MSGVFVTTVSKVSMLLIFIGIGYLLRRTRKLPEDAGRVLSLLTTLFFSPAYTLRNLASSLTPEKLGSQLTLMLFAGACVICAIALAYLLARFLARDDFRRRTCIYGFSIPNYGYFGYPLVEGVFGAGVLSQLMVFCIPLVLACNTFGYLLFAKNGKLTFKKVFTTPLILGVLLGCILGLTGIRLPRVVDDVLAAAGGCMSPASMLLAGFVLGGYPLRELFKGRLAWTVSALRLILIPGIFAGVLWLLGLRGLYLALPVMVFSMPLGMNLVVFPESQGLDAGENAKMCFVCNLLTILTLPIVFTLVSGLL